MQASVRTNDLLNAVHFVNVHFQAERPGAIPLPTSQLQNQAKFSALVGQQYYALKQTLIMDEQLLLRTINFDIVVEHPHKYLLNFGKLTDATHSLIQMAVSILNDSLIYTTLCMSHRPADIAAACIQIAGDLIGPAHHLPFPDMSPGWSSLGILVEQMDSAGVALLDMIAAA